MKRRKNCRKLGILALMMLPVMLDSCGQAEPVDADASRIESLENGDQEAGLPSIESVMNGEVSEPEDVSLEEASGSRTERVDNPDGGWTVSEYGETGEEVRQSIYDADGKQIQAIEYNANGTVKSNTEYEYDDAGEQNRYVTYEYGADGAISKSIEYDGNGRRDLTTIYSYNSDGSLKRTYEYREGAEGEARKVDYGYDADGNLNSASEYVANRQVKHTAYKKDGTVAYYDADFEYDDTGSTKYKTYRADGGICSEREINSAGQMVKYIYYFYENHDMDKEVAGYIVDEYDGDGNVVNKAYYGIEPTSELLNPVLGQQKETEHFVFCCTNQDAEVLETLAETLEGSYSIITSDLGKGPTEKTKVYISPNLMVHHNATGSPDDPDWSVGEGGDGCFYIVSPLNPGPAHTYDDMFPVAVHEFTHVVVIENFGWKVPSYLNEGIAYYEAGQGEGSGYYVQEDMRAGTFPSLKEMDGWKSYVYMSGYDAGRAYAYGGIYVDFLVEKFGFDSVVSLLEGKPQTEVFGMSMEEASEKWMTYLESYKD